jgi:anti-sigma factor (TIGR02949 family)
VTGPPLNCAEAVAQLQDYLKGEITPELAERVRAHLASCVGCLRHAEFERNFLAVLETRLRDTAVPSGLRARILSALDTGPR